MPLQIHSKHINPQLKSLLNALKLLALTSLIIGTTACNDPGAHEAKYLLQAKAYLDQSNLDKARVELKNTLQINPNSADAHLLLGKVEEERQEWRKAFSHYQKASELNPDLIEPYIKLGHFYLLQAANLRTQEKTDEERETIQKVSQQIESALQINSEEIDALLLKSSYLAYNENIEDSISLLLNIIQKHKQSEDSYLLLAKLYRQTDKYEDAEQVLIKGLDFVPDSSLLKSELAKIYTQQNKTDQAIKIMRELANAHPESLNYSLSLAAYYIQNQQLDEAEEIIRDTLKHSPDDIARHLVLAEFLDKNRGKQAAARFLNDAISQHPEESELQFKLANLYIETDTEASVENLNKIINKWKGYPESIRASKILASIYYDSGKYDNSATIIKQVLNENPKDSEALSILGKISFKQKNYDTAITSFRSVLKTRPESLEMIQLLADAYLLNGELELANETLKSAVNISPGNTSGRLQLARFNLANKMPVEALQQVNKILAENQDHIAAIKLKSEILMTSGQYKELPALLDRLKSLSPESPEGWFRMGRFYLSKNQPLLARKELEEAWKKAPQALDLLAELTDLEIRLGKLDIAKSRLNRLLEKTPDHPEAHKFLGMIYLVEKSYSQAESEFIVQLEHSPADPIIYLQLGEINKLQSNLPKAEEYYKQGIKLTRNNIQLQFALAEVLELKQDYDAATHVYKSILNKEPANLVAANNLAIIYADHSDSKEQLIEARNILENLQQSGHPAIIDTLGWVYHKLEKPDRSIPLLKYSISKSPHNPIFNYHLGMAYARIGRDNLAVQHLKTALSSDNFRHKDEASAALETIRQ